MMRTNVATTRLFHQALWAVFDGQLADASLTCRADLTDDDIEPLTFAFEDVLEVAFASDRALPHGRTLGEVGGDEVSELYDHAENQLAALIGRAEDQGVAVVLTWLALRGRSACPTWWGARPGGRTSWTGSLPASTNQTTPSGSAMAPRATHRRR